MLTSGQPTAPGRLDHPRQTLEMEIVAALRKLAGPLGVEINQVRLGAIRVDDDIQAQWIEAWMSRWRYWTLVQRQKGEATREQLRETARAQAQVDMITAVAQAFQDSVSRDARVPAQLLVMRLLEVFDRTTIGEKMYLPDHALNTLERLRRLLE